MEVTQQVAAEPGWDQGSGLPAWSLALRVRLDAVIRGAGAVRVGLSLALTQCLGSREVIGQGSHQIITPESSEQNFKSGVS